MNYVGREFCVEVVSFEIAARIRWHVSSACEKSGQPGL